MTIMAHVGWHYGGTLDIYVSAGRSWHRECPTQRLTGKVAEVWRDACGCLYCLGCHVVQLHENCRPDLGEDA